jgi:hypothetical protein
MISQRVNFSAPSDPAWWHWTATLPFLALNHAGHAGAGWLAGYCPLLQLLSLAWWNRTAPLCFSPVRHVFLRVPCVGGIVYWNSDSSSKVTACCSISADDPPLTCSLPKATVTVQSPRKERCAKVC